MVEINTILDANSKTFHFRICNVFVISFADFVSCSDTGKKHVQMEFYRYSVRLNLIQK